MGKSRANQRLAQGRKSELPKVFILGGRVILETVSVLDETQFKMFSASKVGLKWLLMP